MENTIITIDLKEIAEVLVSTYQWRNTHDHLQVCSGFQILLGEEKYNIVADLCKSMIHERGIKKEVRDI